MPLVRKDAAIPGPPPPSDARTELVSGSPDQRRAAARRLGGEAGDIGLLAAALTGEPDLRVREAILTALAACRTTQAFDAMLPLVRSDNADVRTGALDALRAMPDAIGARLAVVLVDEDSDVRLLACDLARSLPGALAQPLLCALLDREVEINVCAAAVDVLAEVGDAGAVSCLQRCADRFGAEPFLAFAIRAAIAGLSSQASGARG
ncbi:MAG TPA: HEAT repeat domain-containing protein [Caulobacteraceae bacterium]|jgi:HEAT repeat protein|nr:HEAT repeat domain-containing protein [Caulobacteraceae bacterium]